MNDLAKRCSEFLSKYLLPSPREIMNYFCHCPGKLIVIGARPAMGKTGFMLSLIYEIRDYSALSISLELSESQIKKRFDAIYEAKHGHKIFKIINKSQPSLSSQSSGCFGYSEPANLERIRSMLEEQQNKEPVNVVFIDYLQLIKDFDTICLNKLKELAEEFKVAMVVMSQVNKSINDNPIQKPALDDFLVSNPETSMVDEIYYLVRPNYHEIDEDDLGFCMQHQAILYCLKGSFQKKRVLLKFNEKNSVFQQADLFEIILKSKN